MSDSILYSFRRCPYAMRARLALAYALSPGALVLREVVLKDKPQAMLAISPKGTVPVLQLADGRVIDESLDIMNWAIAHNDHDQWSAQGKGNDMRTLINENDGDFKWALDRYKYADRYEHSAEHYRNLAMVFIDKLESMLVNQRYLFSDKISLADAAIFPFVRQFAHVDKAWFDQQALPNVQKWLAGWLDSTLFESIMKKYPQWLPSQDSTRFPA